jgi:hemoglobin
VKAESRAVPVRGGRAKAPELYAEIGGIAACRRLSALFHERVAGDTILRPLFPRDMTRTVEYLARFLGQALGGPADYTAARGKQSLFCWHAHLAIGTAESERWQDHMRGAMEDAGFPEHARRLLGRYFEETAATLTDPLLPLYDMPLDDLERLLEGEPAAIAPVPGRRTLLGAAAAAWDVPRVAFLLDHGADVSARDPLGHDPLYHAAVALAPGREADGSAVMALLLQYGADVHGRSGPGRLTPLHAAARRGTVAVAQTLLGAGADVEANDAKGETPLRRAVNCGHEHMVRLLIGHGADPLSADRRGGTALEAARHDGIRHLLLEAATR